MQQQAIELRRLEIPNQRLDMKERGSISIHLMADSCIDLTARSNGAIQTSWRPAMTTTSDLGVYGQSIATTSSEAQAVFDRGLVWL